MARSVAIVVGVHKPDGMRELPGALTDAVEVSAWAKAAGYETIELVDRDNKRVRVADIYEAIDDIVQAQDTERLLVYFSGHGVSKGIDIDYWILSDGVRNPNGPVNLDRSLKLATRCGIPHVIVFADACRTTANRAEINIDGSVMFPNDHVGSDVHVDIFSATLTGDPALERASQDALDAAYGIFTRCLVSALNGDVPAALLEDLTHTPTRAVVANKLEAYIDAAVAAEAADLDPPVLQVPDSRPGSYYPPHVICWVPDPVASAAGNAQPEIYEVEEAVEVDDEPEEAEEHEAEEAKEELDGDDVVVITTVARPPGPIAIPPGPIGVLDELSNTGRIAAGEFEPIRVPTLERVAAEEARAELESQATADVARLSEPGRPHFETFTGVSVLGAPLRGIAMAAAANHGGPWEENGSWHANAETSGAVVLDLGEDRYACCAMLYGYVATVYVGPSGVDLVSYLPAPGGDAFESMQVNDEIRSQLATLGAASRVGFRGWAIDEARDYAYRFRDQKFRNPSYGIFAAYAYDRAGDAASVKDMLEYFEASTGEVLYDFVLLSDSQVSEYDKVVPMSYPLLSRGWGLMDPEVMHPKVRAAARALGASAWATTTGESGRVLFDAVASGEVQ